MLSYSGFQSLLVLGGHPTQQRKELPIELAYGAFVDQQTTLLQFALNFDQLAMFVLVAPANKGQNVQTIGAVGQTDGQDAAGIVGRRGMRAGRIDAAVTLAGHEERTSERLNVLLDIPGLARSQELTTMQAGLAVTRNDQALGIYKAPRRAMPRLFAMPPRSVIYEA
jgi:hypothetical protein